MTSPNFYFRDAVVVRNELTKRQEKQIRKMYNKWASEVRQEAKRLSSTPGSLQEAREMTKLYYQLRQGSKQLSDEINNKVTSNLNDMGSAVVRVNQRWLKSLGLSSEGLDTKMSVSKDLAIRSILTGNLYQTNEPLSNRVWDITSANMQDINNIIAYGIAVNQSPRDIAKQLERYLKPENSLGWSIRQYTDKYGIKRFAQVHNNIVDWRAQRLARTALQHAYQQTLVALTKDNPFVSGYIWHADGANACQLCMDRDGRFYTPSELPLDHPNGQCDFEVAIDEEKAMNDLAGFYENPILYPDIQRWVE